MELDQAIRERRSIRRFTGESVPRELLEELVELACWAPSASNRQDWRFTVVETAAIRQQVVEAVDARWREISTVSNAVNEGLREYSSHFSSFRHAPVLVAVDIKRTPVFLEEATGKLAERLTGSVTGASMAIQNLLLAAHSRGLGSCVFTGCVAADREIARILGFPRQHGLLALVAVGWPAERPPAPARKPLGQVLRFL